MVLFVVDTVFLFTVSVLENNGKTFNNHKFMHCPNAFSLVPKYTTAVAATGFKMIYQKSQYNLI